MSIPVKVKPRTRNGSYDTFIRRYAPVEQPDGTIWIDHRNVPKDTDLRLVWTILDCDGKLIVTPGYHTVNYMARVICTQPWSDIEDSNPGYLL